MFNKPFLTLAVLASIGNPLFAYADELPPVIDQQQNLLPPSEVSTPVYEQPYQRPTQPVDTRWYVAPYGTFTATDADYVDNHGGGGLAIGKMIDQHFNVEVKGFAENASTRRNYPYSRFYGQSGDVTLAGATADLQYYFMRSKFSPYAVVGLGGMNTGVSGTVTTPLGTSSAKHNSAAFVAEAGVGMSYEVLDNLLLRSDIRYRYSNQNLGGFENTPLGNSQLGALNGSGAQDVNDMTVNVGVVIPFGEKPKAEPYVVAAAPAPTPPIRIATTPDCSRLDSDRDGVNDCVDKSPNTIVGSKVDTTGHPVSLELKGVNFQFDSAQLTPNAMRILDSVVIGLKNQLERNAIEVDGHTSIEGSAAHNQKLSQNRAQAVASYLRSKGVSNRLTARGFGATRPIGSNNTEQGRTQNRRVELVWAKR